MDAELKNAVREILHPLIGHLIEQGGTYPLLSELLKEIYVAQVLQRDRGRTEVITDSRVSLLTGIHRKDVKRLRAMLSKENAPSGLPRGASLAVRVVAEWISAPRYRNARGRPKPLPEYAAVGKPSFEALVKKVKADMRPAVVLDELLRAGVAKREGDKIRLLRSAYVPELPREKLAFLGANVGDHLRSALHNVAGKDDAFLERAVYYGLIDAVALQEARPELVKRTERFLQEINQLMMPLNTMAIARATKNGRRMRLGVYYYEDEGAPAPKRHGAGGTREHKRRSSDES